METKTARYLVTRDSAGLAVWPATAQPKYSARRMWEIGKDGIEPEHEDSDRFAEMPDEIRAAAGQLEFAGRCLVDVIITATRVEGE